MGWGKKQRRRGKERKKEPIARPHGKTNAVRREMQKLRGSSRAEREKKRTKLRSDMKRRLVQLRIERTIKSISRLAAVRVRRKKERVLD